MTASTRRHSEAVTLLSRLITGFGTRNSQLDRAMPVVTFDFDGVLQMGSPFVAMDAMKPREDMHHVLRREAEVNTVAIVTGRADACIADLWQFAKIHALPIADVVTTNGDSKLPALIRLGAIRHYDDDPDVGRELEDTSVEFALVSPPTSTP